MASPHTPGSIDGDAPGGIVRPLLAALAVITAAAVGGGLLWWRYGERVRWSDAALLQPAAIEVRGLAPWVRADIRAEALHTASLDHGVPIDDPRLPTLLARAFDMHPWVREVVRVEVRDPPAAVVEVVCREPVAMVRVPGGLLAIDAEGFFLPSADFTAESAAGFPKITGIVSSPQGPEGSRWGDPAVEEGAAIVAALGPQWRQLGLAECRAGANGRSVWDLLDDAGRVIRFGAAPGREVAGEPNAAAKIARLKAGVVAGTEEAPCDLTRSDDR
ncbi:MAG: hypothetical protein ACKOCW_01915 [Planctomycetaceae bacterium]